MDTVAEFTQTVQNAVENYAKGGWIKANGYAVSDTKRQIYLVMAVPDYPRKFPAGVVVAARVKDDKVFIDEDTTDKPLWEELVRMGIPREQIVLLYAGEK